MDKGTAPGIVLHLVCRRLVKAHLELVLGGKGGLLPTLQFPWQLIPGGFFF